MNWKIYYTDSTFSNIDGSHWDAPTRDAQVIIIFDKDHGWRTQSGGDFYVWDRRGMDFAWWAVDLFGLYDYLLGHGPKKVIFGRQISKHEYGRIFAKAMRDPDFPKKTAYDKQEQKP